MAPNTFCRIPPIGPTEPSTKICPVPAIRYPLVRSSSVSWFMISSANTRPADGPPMLLASISTSTGNLISSPYALTSKMPTMPRSGSSWMDPSSSTYRNGLRVMS